MKSAKLINKLAFLILIICIIAIPIIVFLLNSSTNSQIEENAARAQDYAKTSAQRISDKENEYALIDSEIPGIVCIGSDLMASTGTVNTYFTKELQDKLSAENYRTEITNLAVPGENAATILGRIGVIPFVIDEDVTIPSKSDLIPVKLASSKDGAPIWPLAVAADNASFNPVTVDGHIGMIGGDSQRNPQTGENNHYFVRLEDGEAFTLHKGSVINTSSDDEFKDYVHIIWIGENENWSDWNDLADYIEQIVDSCGANKERYIVMGLISGSNEGMAEYDSVMEERFGTHFLNIRKYLSEYNLYKTTAEYTDQDFNMQEQGIVPSCFLQSKGGLNDIAYKIITDYVYEELKDNDCIKKPQ